MREDYAKFAALEGACVEFCDRVNAREHRITRRAPAVMLAEERARLHQLPEVASHALTTPGRPSIDEAHYPPRPAGAIERKPRARSADEQAFLQIGAGAEVWLIAAAAAGASRVRRKLAEAVDLAKLHGHEQVDEALRAAADAGRFADGDLAAILAHHGGEVIAFPARACEEQSLQRSTRSWEGFAG